MPQSIETLFCESYIRYVGMVVAAIFLLGLWKQELILFSMHFLLLGLLLGVPICAFSSIGVHKRG